MAGIESLPLSNLGSCFVFLRAAYESWTDWSELLENLLFQHRAYIGGSREVGLSTGKATFAAHMDEIGEGLSSSSSLVEISPFASECICRNYTLRLELVVAHGTTKLYLTQRCHGCSSSLLGTSGKREGISVPQFQKLFFLRGIGLVESLGRLYLLASQKPRQAPNPRDLVVDAHQPTA